mgnify:CR=1 FL=1|jgi:hypothetical protein
MKEKEFENLLLVEGVNAQGYGTIPKLVMKDRRLTPQAKAIYAYFCSYAGCGSTAFPKVSQIMYDLNISNKTYYKHFDLLTEFGYITVVKIKKEGNKFDNNIYKLNTNPKKTVVENLHNGEENIELSTENIQKKEKNVDNPVDNSRSVDSPSWKNSMTQISTTRNYTTNINNNNINSFNNNINWDELSDEEKEYLLNWIDHMMKE